MAGRLRWWTQVISGALLVALLGLHWLAQHYLAAGGLRSFAEVVAYVRQPVVFVLEAAFLLTVTLHALLGLQAIGTDLGLPPRAARILDWALAAAGLATVWYGLDLLITISRL